MIECSLAFLGQTSVIRFGARDLIKTDLVTESIKMCVSQSSFRKHSYLQTASRDGRSRHIRGHVLYGLQRAVSLQRQRSGGFHCSLAFRVVPRGSLPDQSEKLGFQGIL